MLSRTKPLIACWSPPAPPSPTTYKPQGTASSQLGICAVSKVAQVAVPANEWRWQKGHLPWGREAKVTAAADGGLGWACRGSTRRHRRQRQDEQGVGGGAFSPAWPSGAGSAQAGVVYFGGALLAAPLGSQDVKVHAAANQASQWPSRG